MFWFWFAVVDGLLALALDAAWWVVAMRLTKRRLWRVLVSVFMAGQMIALFSAMCGGPWCLYTPNLVLVGVVVWHFFVLPFGLAVRLLLGSVRAGGSLVRRSTPATPC